MGIGNFLNQLDEGLVGLVSQWNGYSTAIATLLVLVVTYSIMTRVDPEIHPMLLARQAQGSMVRQEGESPVYRANSAPHGMPLNSGLNVKAPGASKWSLGKDGDLRDVWRRAVSGPPAEDGPGGKGRILTVLGTRNTVEHKLDDISLQINLIGRHIASQGGSRVAIYLPNSVEFMTTLFACSFHNLTAVLLPFAQPDEVVISMLQRSGADTVVTAPGAFPFDRVVKNYPALRQLVWVVDPGSNHLDWNEVPQGMGGQVNVSTWQDILQENPPAAGDNLPAADNESEVKDVVFFWKSRSEVLEEMVSFTQGNLAAAVSAQLTAVPGTHRWSTADLFLPAASLSGSFSLTLTFAALWANASVAFNSVAGGSPDLVLATAGIAPTIVLATPQSLLKTHEETTGKLTSFVARTAHWAQTRSLVQDGVMPAASIITQYNDSLRPALGVPPGKLRLLYVAESAGADAPRLSERVLSDLRIFTGARVIYALTAAKVAGSVTQTALLDFRVHDDGSGTHFGVPVSSIEMLLRDSGSYRTTDTSIAGEVVARGPSVAGGEAALGVVGRMREDNTLEIV